MFFFETAPAKRTPTRAIEVIENEYDDIVVLHLELDALLKRQQTATVCPLKQKKNVTFDANGPEVFVLDYTLDRRPHLWKDVNYYSIHGSEKTRIRARRKLASLGKVQGERTLVPIHDGVKDLTRGLNREHWFNELNHSLCTSIDCKLCSTKRVYPQSTPVSMPFDFITGQLDPNFIEDQILKVLKEGDEEYM